MVGAPKGDASGLKPEGAAPPNVSSFEGRAPKGTGDGALLAPNVGADDAALPKARDADEPNAGGAWVAAVSNGLLVGACPNGLAEDVAAGLGALNVGAASAPPPKGFAEATVESIGFKPPKGLADGVKSAGLIIPNTEVAATAGSGALAPNDVVEVSVDEAEDVAAGVPKVNVDPFWVPIAGVAKGLRGSVFLSRASEVAGASLVVLEPKIAGASALVEGAPSVVPKLGASFLASSFAPKERTGFDASANENAGFGVSAFSSFASAPKLKTPPAGRPSGTKDGAATDILDGDLSFESSF